MDVGELEALTRSARQRGASMYGLTPTPEQGPARGEAWSPTAEALSRPLLRCGFFLQLVALLIGIVTYIVNGGRGVFTFDLFSIPEEFRFDKTFSTTLLVLESLCLVGALCLAGFQTYAPDSSKSSRGFRAGSKMLSTAVTLDIVVVALRLTQYFYSANFLSSRWWLKYTQSPTDWCLFHATGLAHAFALALYGLAIFYLETYHEVGVADEWGWTCLILFLLAAFFEVSLVLAHVGSFGTLVHCLAVLVAFIWALHFEPLSHEKAPALHDRNINQGLIAPEAPT